MPINPDKSWGLLEDQEFIVTAFTNSFDDNKKVAVVRQTDTFLLFVEYEKGTETEMQVQLSFSLYKDEDMTFAIESIVDVNTSIVTPFFYRIQNSGKIRLAIPISPNEVLVEVAVKALGVPTGNAKLSFTTSNLRSK